MERGLIQWYSKTKGFGFIKSAERASDKDLFFHSSALDGDFEPDKGDPIEFERGVDRSGRPKAVRVINPLRTAA